MDAKSFYGARPRTRLALVPDDPRESDGDLSDDQVEDPDYEPTQGDDAGDSSFESLDEEEAPSKSRSFTKPYPMGGIDLSDMLVHLYKTPARSRRWYLPLFGYILDLCIANSWLLYKRDSGLLNEKPMSLKQFRLAVGHSLNQFNKPASKVGRPSSSSPPPEQTGYISRPSRPKPQTDVRYDNMGHWPLHCEKRGRCNLCPKGVSRWKCEKCNVFLCLNASQECFKLYHQR